MNKEVQIFIIGFAVAAGSVVTTYFSFRAGYNTAIEHVIEGCKLELQKQGLNPQDYDQEVNDFRRLKI